MHCSETWITLSFTSISTFCWHLYLTKNLSGTLFSGVNRFQAGKTNQKVSHLVQYLCTWITCACESNVYVVQFYPCFKFYFPLFLGAVMCDNEFETKGNKIGTKDKIEPQHV